MTDSDAQYTAYILVEVSADSEEQLRRHVATARRALHALAFPLADLPYYENAGPRHSCGERIVNRWADFRALFSALPWRGQS